MILEAMNFKIFENFPQLNYGWSLKENGNMKLNPRENFSDQNRQQFLESRGVDSKRLVSGLLAHSINIYAANERDAGTNIHNIDGLVTASKNLFLSITVADCFPVLAYDPVTGNTGIAHAGWRGIVSGIAKNLISTMKELGSQSQNIFVGIGPGLQKCHFEIKHDVLNEFESYRDYVSSAYAKVYIDLPGSISNQLVEAGLPEKNIEASSECTYELENKYFSHRRDKTDPVEAMMAYIGRI
jgi:hypothetical protein